MQHDKDRTFASVALCGGTNIMLHPMSAGPKEGQAFVKLVFDVPDVAAFCDAAHTNDLAFGAIHQADGEYFANATDSVNNSV